MTAEERFLTTGGSFLITGGRGFLGAWIARRLLADGALVTILDASSDGHILQQVLEPQDLARVRTVTADIADGSALDRALEDSGARSIIHLAGLQVPSCRVDPPLGARVNLAGTLGVFEAVRRHREQVRSVVYASSAAVAGPPGDYGEPIPDGASHLPRTHYGVFKLACEQSARVYWLDNGIPSVGLRPLVVYGVGREVGLTSGPTKAVKSAVLQREYTIPFSGVTGFSYVEDVAEVFVVCARVFAEGAQALNIRGDVLSVDDFVRVVESVLPGASGRIRVSGPAIPFAYDTLDAGLEKILGRVPRTPVSEGVRRMATRFQELRARGKLPVQDLEA